MWISRLKLFFTPLDGRFEDLTKGKVHLNVLRDFTAGLIVSMVAIPLAMGFAMASGLRPEQGIVGGALAGLVGALFSGSKYQVYGPTAAFIPIIAMIMKSHDHGFLVLVSIFAAILLLLMGLSGAGRFVKLVPHSIVVGFTIGIAVTIAMSQLGEVLGLDEPLGHRFIDKMRGLRDHMHEFEVWALVFAVGTLVLTRLLLRISVFLPAPLIALGVGLVLSQTLLVDEGLTLIKTKYGAIPAQSLILTPPDFAALTMQNLGSLVYYTLAVVFVAAIESLLCSRMADRLAGNKGTPYNPNKELWGQGMVMLLVPLLNGFPHTGALARTATSIKLGAVSPLAGFFKFALKLLLAFYLARYLELVPMACIGGILLFVAMNMVKPSEVEEVLKMGRGHTLLMIYTAVAVIVTDFLTGVLTALVIYAVWQMKNSEKPAKAEADGEARRPLRAVLGREQAIARRPMHNVMLSSERRKWLTHLQQRAHIAPSAFIHPQANVIGRVVLGDHVHIAATSSVRADEGSPFFIGAHSNIQDGVVIHALKDRLIQVKDEKWAVYVGKKVSLAHGALIHGPSYIGDHSFIGFNSVVHDSVIGEGCYVGIGAVVVGVEIAAHRYVPHGMIVDTPQKAANLPLSSEAQQEFNEDVVEVNRGLVDAYRHHHAEGPPHVSSMGTAAAAISVLRIEPQAGWEPPSSTANDDRF